VAGVWRKEKGMSLAEIRAYDATRFQLEVLEEQIKRENEAQQNSMLCGGMATSGSAPALIMRREETASATPASTLRLHFS
jgi:hypothetical protein